MPGYFNADIEQLAHQLTISPRRLRLSQVFGIEDLLAIVDPERAYPYDWVCYRITRYHKRGADTGALIPGKALISDLVRMAERISRNASIAVGEITEPHLSQQEVAAELRVSSKTIRRWRSRGLLGIRVVFADGVNRSVILRRSMGRFVARHRDLVEKAASFRQLTPAEREHIIDRARQLLTHKRMKLHETARVISAETGRAVETIRYTLRRYDGANKGQALFGVLGQPQLTGREEAIWNARQAGESVASLAAAYDCSTDEIKRIVRELQIRQWREQPITYIHNELFDAPNADQLILDVPESPATDAPMTAPPAELPAYLRAMYRVPLLTAEQEQDLFRRYNYLKHRAALLVKSLDPCGATPSQVDEVRDLTARYEQLRQRIIRANLRLVVSVAKKHVGWSNQFFEVISDGNISLMRAVEKFDYARGFRFSTYASWAIVKNYARTAPEERYRLGRCVTGQDELLAAVPDYRETAEPDHDAEQVRQLLKEGLSELSEREREVVTARFGLFSEAGGKTLQQIGDRYGVTKERIRQIERRAMNKLKAVLPPSLADMVAA